MALVTFAIAREWRGFAQIPTFVLRYIQQEALWWCQNGLKKVRNTGVRIR